MQDLDKITADLSMTWTGFLRDWDRSLRSGNYPEPPATTTCSPLPRWPDTSANTCRTPEADDAAEDPTAVSKAHVEAFQAWMIQTRSASTALNKHKGLQVIDEHVDPVEGVDWAGLQASLTDPAWSLPDGRKISELFGEGWPEVCDTVSAQLGEWRRLDEDVLGPEPTLRLLTIGGSTSYTRHWWGQGRWSAMCRAVVEDAVDGGIALPSPYDELGVERFVADLAEPDQLSDELLGWLIDMPAGEVDGPHGLRFHKASRPISRVVEPAEWGTD